MRRPMLALAVLAVLAALCGCARHDANEITFWHIQTGTPMKGVVEEAVRTFGDESGSPVQIVAYNNDLFKTKLDVAMSAGNPPDVFHTWGGGKLKSLVGGGMVLDLTSRVRESGLDKRILPAALGFATFDGSVYAVPVDVAPVVMWYNREIFADAGVAPPKTFDDLLAVCETLRAKGITPIALGNRDKWPGAFYFIYLSARLGGPKPFAEAAARVEGASFEHPSFIEAGRKLRALVDAKAFNDGALALSYDESRDLFFGGKSAMMLMGTWILGNARNDAPGFLDHMDCFAFPQVAGGAPDGANVVVAGINAAYAVSSRCTQPDAAFGLLETLCREPFMRQWAATGRIPALRRELAADMLQPETRKAADIFFGADFLQLYYDQYLPPRLAERHKDTTQGLFAGTQTPEGAAREMETLARTIAQETD